MIMTGWFLEASTVQEFIGAVLQWMSMGDALTWRLEVTIGADFGISQKAKEVVYENQCSF